MLESNKRLKNPIQPPVSFSIFMSTFFFPFLLFFLKLFFSSPFVPSMFLSLPHFFLSSLIPLVFLPHSLSSPSDSLFPSIIFSFFSLIHSFSSVSLSFSSLVASCPLCFFLLPRIVSLFPSSLLSPSFSIFLPLSHSRHSWILSLPTTASLFFPRLSFPPRFSPFLSHSLSFFLIFHLLRCFFILNPSLFLENSKHCPMFHNLFRMSLLGNTAMPKNVYSKYCQKNERVTNTLFYE